MNSTLALASFLAQAAAPSAPQGGLADLGPAPMLILMGVMFYFLLIRPQQKQRKEQQARLDALQVGDKVVTTAGILALVHHIKETTVTLKIAEGTLVEFEKAAIAKVTKKDTEVAK